MTFEILTDFLSSIVRIKLLLMNNYKCVHKITDVSGCYIQPAKRKAADCWGTVLEDVSPIFMFS